MLAGNDDSSNIVYNYISEDYDIVCVITEKKSIKGQIVDRYKFLKRRVKKLGFKTTLGQVLFLLFVNRPLRKKSEARIKQIINQNKLDNSPIPLSKTFFVESINSDLTIQKLKELSPDVVVVNGTRIIAARVLECVNCKFINTHAGITPKYRGVHGMYWALVNNDKDNAGVTVHFVDNGIDTGLVISQAKAEASEEDNFTTYFYLQISEGVKLLKKAISDLFNNNLKMMKGPNESHLYYHPTIWEYKKNGVK